MHVFRGLIVPSKEKKKDKRSRLMRKLGRSKTDNVLSQSQRAPGLVGLLETLRVQMEVLENIYIFLLLYFLILHQLGNNGVKFLYIPIFSQKIKKVKRRKTTFTSYRSILLALFIFIFLLGVQTFNWVLAHCIFSLET